MGVVGALDGQGRNDPWALPMEDLNTITPVQAQAGKSIGTSRRDDSKEDSTIMELSHFKHRGQAAALIGLQLVQSRCVPGVTRCVFGWSLSARSAQLSPRLVSPG